MSNRRPFFIDTDTASDDAVALVIALRHPDIDVVGIGVVAGNVPLEQGVQNALYTRDLCGRSDVPVYGGSYRPIVLPLSTAQHVHGQDGMDELTTTGSSRVLALSEGTITEFSIDPAYYGLAPATALR